MKKTEKRRMKKGKKKKGRGIRRKKATETTIKITRMRRFLISTNIAFMAVLLHLHLHLVIISSHSFFFLHFSC